MSMEPKKEVAEFYDPTYSLPRSAASPRKADGFDGAESDFGAGPSGARAPTPESEASSESLDQGIKLEKDRAWRHNVIMAEKERRDRKAREDRVHVRARGGKMQPLLFCETNRLLTGRMLQQKSRIRKLQMMGITTGNADSYATWITHQAPTLQKCWEYTGLGSGGFGQGPRGASVTGNLVATWTEQKLQMLEKPLEVLEERRPPGHEGMGQYADVLTEEEAVQMCNLMPGSANEAIACIPALDRFYHNQPGLGVGSSTYGLNEMCTEVLQLQDRTVGDAPVGVVEHSTRPYGASQSMGRADIASIAASQTGAGSIRQ